MTKVLDLKGETFNRLLVTERVENNKHGQSQWCCLCSCGNISVVNGTSLVSGKTKSCGCLNKEKIGNLNKSHGKTRSPTYNSWRSMKERCYNENNSHYQYYGARGVVVCERWKNSFENFYQDMGERPEGLTLERINVDLEYSPENCKWDTASNQAFNIKIKCNNKSGRTGVHLRNNGKYTASITKDDKQIYLGYFDNYEEACLAREKAELELYGFVKQ